MREGDRRAIGRVPTKEGAVPLYLCKKREDLGWLAICWAPYKSTIKK